MDDLFLVLGYGLVGLVAVLLWVFDVTLAVTGSLMLVLFVVAVVLTFMGR